MVFVTLKLTPLKGTSPRFESKELDEKSKQFLENSEKDHAELHMIVDLMRNDFFRICGPGNVSVKDPGTVYSFSNVHHLIASVVGKLDKKISLGECLGKIMPWWINHRCSEKRGYVSHIRA